MGKVVDNFEESYFLTLFQLFKAVDFFFFVTTDNNLLPNHDPLIKIGFQKIIHVIKRIPHCLIMKMTQNHTEICGFEPH